MRNARPAPAGRPIRRREKPEGLNTQIIYCGDCLDQLRQLPDASIDLIYIDPPFNSNRDYEVFWGETKEKRAFEDRHASTAAYIDFMRPRCVELARVLRSTGSLYYHCDWHASHYVKVMLDQILGENQFQNEIVWLRTTSHNDSRRAYGTLSDSIFFYTGTEAHTFNVQFVAYSEEYIKNNFRFKDEKGYYSSENLRSPNPRPNLTYEYKGFKPHRNGWTVSREKMEQLDREGRLIFPKSPEGRIRVKKYLDEMSGVPVGNIWTDIPQLSSQSSERLGYPTQKPLALLDRIIKTSSNPADIVLDAFCGCGTAIVSAQNLGRRWIGIDISPTACRVMAKRLRKDCGLIEGEDFVVRDLPRSEDELRKIPPFEFENWAVIALGGIKNKTQVGDMGIDGRVYPAHSMPTKREDQLGFMDVWYPIQVKQKDRAGRPDIDAFEAAMIRENRTKGFFVSFAFTRDALTEIGAFFRREGRVIVPLTVREILDEEIATKLV